tara:strand:+ start:417 stop:2153 length:1737 start_codon:yes stop_codon:yes gene_type:complete
MAGLGRTVTARHRMARMWALGDRVKPASYTPGLVISNVEEFDVNWAPFLTTGDGSIPRSITLESRAPFAPWENPENGPKLIAKIGHVLPPSLDEADAGEVASKDQLLPISWQSMNHDTELLSEELKPHVVVLTDALQLANRPGKLVEAIHVIKTKFPGALLWTPGIGGPDNCAVLAWFGVDLFDTTRSQQAESHGAILTWAGPRMKGDFEPVFSHWESALAEVRFALENNSLRELAQAQSLNSPKLIEHMRNHDKLISKKTGILNQVVENKTTLRVNNLESHDDAIILDWVDFIENRYRRPESLDEVLILLPCSARKPYSASRSHKYFRNAINHNSAHEVMVTSPLGLVPRDIETVWPAGYYDIPVTGDWAESELTRIQNMLLALISNNSYRVVINHSGIDLKCPIPVIDTRQGYKATSDEALELLSTAVSKNMQKKRRGGEKMNLDNFRSVARFHHKNDSWLDRTEIKGRFPRWKIMKSGEQIAMWAPERGGFSISKAGIPYLKQHNSLKSISIKEGIKWKGDINLANLETFDSSIRAGEDLLVMQGAECVGTARATAPAWEWKGTPGRLAKMHQRL